MHPQLPVFFKSSNNPSNLVYTAHLFLHVELSTGIESTLQGLQPYSEVTLPIPETSTWAQISSQMLMLVNPYHLWASMLSALIWYRSYVNSYSGWDFMSAVVLSCPEETILHRFHILSIYNPAKIKEPLESLRKQSQGGRVEPGK